MNPPIDINLLALIEIVELAPTNPIAEHHLRDFVKSASEKAPVNELVRIGEALVENLKEFRKEHAGNN